MDAKLSFDLKELDRAAAEGTVRKLVTRELIDRGLDRPDFFFPLLEEIVKKLAHVAGTPKEQRPDHVARVTVEVEFPRMGKSGSPRFEQREVVV